MTTRLLFLLHWSTVGTEFGGGGDDGGCFFEYEDTEIPFSCSARHLFSLLIITIGWILVCASPEMSAKALTRQILSKDQE